MFKVIGRFVECEETKSYPTIGELIKGENAIGGFEEKPELIYTNTESLVIIEIPDEDQLK